MHKETLGGNDHEAPGKKPVSYSLSLAKKRQRVEIPFDLLDAAVKGVSF